MGTSLEDILGKIATLSAPVISGEESTARVETVGESMGIDKDPPPPTSDSAVNARNLFRHPDSHPLVLDLCLLKKYGPEWLIWEPESVQLILEQENNYRPSDLAITKLQGIKTLHVADVFWGRWETFNWCTMALNSMYPDFEVMQVPTIAQVLTAVDIAAHVREDVVFSDEVKAFVTSVFRNEDVFMRIPPCDFISIDFSGLPFTAQELDRAWSEPRAQGPETPVSEQVRRARQLYQLLESERNRLRTQLEIIQHA